MDILNHKGWAVTIKEPLELKNVTPSKALDVCSVQKSGHFLSPGLEVTKYLSPLDGMLIYVSTLNGSPTEMN